MRVFPYCASAPNVEEARRGGSPVSAPDRRLVEEGVCSFDCRFGAGDWVLSGFLRVGGSPMGNFFGLLGFRSIHSSFRGSLRRHFAARCTDPRPPATPLAHHRQDRKTYARRHRRSSCQASGLQGHLRSGPQPGPTGHVCAPSRAVESRTCGAADASFMP